MSSLDQARETQLRNIETKAGKSLAELRKMLADSGLTKHSELRKMFQEKLGLGYGDANALVHFALQSDAQSAAEASGATTEDVVAEIYAGNKEALRPVHDQVMAAIHKLGTFDIVPKKGYVSLRRKKQFAMVGPASKMRVEVGLNMKGVDPTERLIELPKGGMCQYKVYLTEASEVDPELIAWVRQAYENAG